MEAGPHLIFKAVAHKTCLVNVRQAKVFNSACSGPVPSQTASQPESASGFALWPFRWLLAAPALNKRNENVPYIKFTGFPTET